MKPNARRLLSWVAGVCFFIPVTGLICSASGGTPALPVVLDGDTDEGNQGAGVVETVQAGDRVSLEVYGRDVEGLVGYYATVVYEPEDVQFKGFKATDLIPELTGLVTSQTDGVLEIGGATVSGAATSAKGLMGVLTFEVAAGFLGQTDVSISAVSLLRDGETTVHEGLSTVALGGTPPSPIALDSDLNTGYQGGASLEDVEPGQLVTIDIHGSQADSANGFSATVTFDPSAVSFDAFRSGDLIPNLTGVVIRGTSGTVEVGGAAPQDAASADAGVLGKLIFRVSGGFSGSTDISITSGTLGRVTGSSTYETVSTVTLLGLAGVGSGLATDFNADGIVDFDDFLLFVGGFGTRQGQAGFDIRFDLAGNGVIDFEDFLAFVNDFGKRVGASKPVLQETGSGANAAARLMLSAETTEDIVRTTVSLEDVLRLQGYELVVRYDPQLLTFVDAHRADDALLGNAGSTPLFLARQIEPGVLILAEAIVGAPSATGHGPLADIVFQRTGADGDGMVTIADALLFSGLGDVDKVRGELSIESAAFALEQNHPNPFNPDTQIVYAVPELADVRLGVYSPTGQLVAELVNRAHEPGRYTISWDARDSAGGEVASGVYFTVLQTDRTKLVRKMLLLK